MDSNKPMIVVTVVSGLATHARLVMYPATLFIQWGSIDGEYFVPSGASEVIPLVTCPELKDLCKNGCWDLGEIPSLLDGITSDYLMSDEVKLVVYAHRGIGTSVVSGA